MTRFLRYIPRVSGLDGILPSGCTDAVTIRSGVDLTSAPLLEVQYCSSYAAVQGGGGARGATPAAAASAATTGMEQLLLTLQASGSQHTLQQR